MTAETSTTISSISGATNIHTISGASKPQHVQKRTIHQFETDKIEVQLSEQTPAPPTRLGKVSLCVVWLLKDVRDSVTPAIRTREEFISASKELENSQALQPRETKSSENDVVKAKTGENMDFFPPFAHFEDDFPIFDDPFSHTPLTLDARDEWAWWYSRFWFDGMSRSKGRAARDLSGFSLGGTLRLKLTNFILNWDKIKLSVEC